MKAHLQSPARRFVGILLLCVAAAAGAQAPQPAQAPLSLGVLPNVSARVNLATYQPVREHLEKELGRSVEIGTAVDFRAYTERAIKGDFQWAVMPPNIGRMLQADAGWIPVLIYEPGVPAVLVAGAGNPSDGVDQLRGKALALANPQSLVALRGLQWLAEQGVQSGRDFQLRLAANDDSLGFLIASGEAPLAMMSMGEFRSKPEAVRAKLRLVREFARLPGFLVMMNPALPAAEAERLRKAMVDFPRSEKAPEFFRLSGFSGMRPVSEAELRPLDAFLEQTRAGLGRK